MPWWCRGAACCAPTCVVGVYHTHREPNLARPPAAPRAPLAAWPASARARGRVGGVRPRSDRGRSGRRGGGCGGGRGTGLGAASGAGVGPGTGDEAGYIFPASPRTAILPPLASVPGSVAGRTYHVKFWVSVEGRVIRVEVEPPIADAAYGREFQQRMMAYQFYPAHTRDGRNVTYVVTVPLRIGN